MKISKIFLGGFVVGVLDISYAILFWWLRARVSPVRIFQSVAAGLLGRDAARAGGIRTALLGAALHFLIAFTIVLVYASASRMMPLLIRRPILCGTVYGVLVYAVMNYVVIPLSAAGGGGGGTVMLWIVCSILVHAFLIGVPAALFSRQALGGAK